MWQLALLAGRLLCSPVPDSSRVCQVLPPLAAPMPPLSHPQAPRSLCRYTSAFPWACHICRSRTAASRALSTWRNASAHADRRKPRIRQYGAHLLCSYATGAGAQSSCADRISVVGRTTIRRKGASDGRQRPSGWRT